MDPRRGLRLIDAKDDPASTPVRKLQALAWANGVELRITLVRQATTYTCMAVGAGVTRSVTLTSSFVPGHVEVGAFGASGVVGSVFVAGPQ